MNTFTDWLINTKDVIVLTIVILGFFVLVSLLIGFALSALATIYDGGIGACVNNGYTIQYCEAMLR